VISAEAMKRFISAVSVMNFPPTGDGVPAALAEAIEQFAESDEQLDWLRNQMQIRYQDWPGVRELRACFCSRFEPKDGVSIPTDVLAVGGNQAGDTSKRLPPGRAAASDERADTAFKIALVTQAMKDISFNSPATPEEIAAAPEWLRKMEGYE
jgi:hypothetical protein